MYRVVLILAAAAGMAVSSGAMAQSAQPIARAVFLNNMDSEFRKMDADKNGTVTAAELLDFKRATSILEAQRANRALFAKLDADRNGQISQAEFARLASPPPNPNISPMLTKFDSNRDKSITLIEYRTGTLANFDKLDVDKDGYVSATEMRAGGIGD